MVAVADIQDFFDLRIAAAALPFAHRLPGDLQLLGELLLCQAVAAPYLGQPITKCHTLPPSFPVPPVYAPAGKKSIILRLRRGKISYQAAQPEVYMTIIPDLHRKIHWILWLRRRAFFGILCRIKWDAAPTHETRCF